MGQKCTSMFCSVCCHSALHVVCTRVLPKTFSCSYEPRCFNLAQAESKRIATSVTGDPDILSWQDEVCVLCRKTPGVTEGCTPLSKNFLPSSTRNKLHPKITYKLSCNWLFRPNHDQRHITCQKRSNTKPTEHISSGHAKEG